MKRLVPKQYKPAELKDAINALYAIILDELMARDIVMALYDLGYKIVYTGDPERSE